MNNVTEAKFVDITHRFLLVLVLRALQKTNPSVLQDVMSKLHTALEDLPENSPVRTPLQEFLETVAHNSAESILRKARKP